MAKNSNNTVAGKPFASLIEEIKARLDAEFSKLISAMFDDADEKLFEMADAAINNEERNRLFELMRNFRDFSPEISSSFVSRIKHNLRPFSETEAEKQTRRNIAEDELSLVDQDEMEDMVLIKSLSNNAIGWFHEPISHLEARLEHLTHQTEDIFSSNALSPVSICEAYDDALDNKFESANKKILFRIFNDSVLTKLDTIYDMVNTLLIDAGVLPKIKLKAPKPASTHSPAIPPGQQADSNNAGEEAEEPMNQGGYAMTAAPGHRHQSPAGAGTSANVQAHAGGSSAPGDRAVGANSGRPGPGGGAGSTSGGGRASYPDSPSTSGTTDGSGQYQHQTGGMPASEVSEAIGEFLGAPIAPPPPAGEDSPSFPSSTPQYYGHQEILDALSGLQLKPEFNEAQELVFDADAIKRAVLAQISAKSGGVVTKSINRIAEKTIDFIELIFDAIIDDPDISDTIKALLLRLQIPVIKASMMDQEFFIYDDHPARVFLDRVTEAGIGVSEHSDEVYIFLNELITKLVNEFELQTSSFQAALDDLNEYIEERDAAAQAKEEESQRQVLREHARSTVLQALRGITAGKTLPEPVHPLVLKRWPTLMFNHYLSHGKENDEWVTIVEVLRDIIDSVQPLTSASELRHLLSTRDSLIETTLSYLNRTSQSKQDIEKVIQGLKDVHQSHIDGADFPEEDAAEAGHDADEQEVVTEQQAAEAEAVTATEEKPPLPQLHSNIVPGMWFQVYLGEDQIPRRCKLSVIILQDSKLVFVNYQGEIITEKNIEEFNSELEDGRSKMIMGHSVFDHALNRVITNLHTIH